MKRSEYARHQCLYTANESAGMGGRELVLCFGFFGFTGVWAQGLRISGFWGRGFDS